MRAFYDVINDPVQYSSSNTDESVFESSFKNTLDAQNTNRLYASPYIAASEGGPPVRPEYGFRKMHPYVEILLGPDGHGVAPESERLQAVHGLAHVYHMSHEIPQVALVRTLARIDWPEHGVRWTPAKIDYFVPPFLFDRRLDDLASGDALSKLIYRADFGHHCPWMPIQVTDAMIVGGKHRRYCAMVCRLYLLERIVNRLEKEAKDNITLTDLIAEMQNTSDEEELEKRRSTTRKAEEQRRLIHLAIKEASKWQDMMVGTVLYMERAEQYTDEWIDAEFERNEQSRGSSVCDTGTHWVLHEGELPDISATIPHLPYWSPTEVRRQRNKRARGRSAEAGAIGDMRGTPFESDPYVCAILTIMKHGLPQPNQIRNADIVISNLIRKFKGRDEWEADKAQVCRSKLAACAELISNMAIDDVGKFGEKAASEKTEIELPESVVSARLDLMKKCEAIYKEAATFNDKRLGGDDIRLARCCRTNRNKLRDALASRVFVNVVASLRAFLGMPEVDLKKTGARDDNDVDEISVDDLFDDSTSQSGTAESMKMGAKSSSWTPKWCSVKQKSIQSRDHTVSTSSGGHNAHRLLDFMIRIVGVSLLGRYERARTRPNFYTVKEIYRLVQFDYPSIDDFCAWLDTPFPEDLQKSAAKRAQKVRPQNASSSTARRATAPKRQPVCGSDIRRYFIVYVIREFHIHTVRQMPGLWRTFQRLYRWDEIVQNISETCDAIRFLVNRYILKFYEHIRVCTHPNAAYSRDRKHCDYCAQWREIKRTYPKRLVEIYRRWPILYAVDMAARWKPDPSDHSERASNKSTYIQCRHKDFLNLCWRPAMRLFSRNVLDNISHIDSIMRSMPMLMQNFAPKNTKLGVLSGAKNSVPTPPKDMMHALDRAELERLSRDAMKHYERSVVEYNETMRDGVAEVVKMVVSRFSPGSNVGNEWLMLLGVKMRSILLLKEAQRSIESEDKRSESYYKLLEILAFNGMDFFVLRTFYETLVHHNSFQIRHLDARTLRTQVATIAEKLGRKVVKPDEPIPECFTQFYVCLVHGKLNAALVGTELGEEGQKNTKSFGHNGISIDHSMEGGGNVFCTTSGKRVDKREATDVFWECMRRKNIKVDMLGAILQVYGTRYVMCPHCGNPMEHRWERFCCGDLVMWCGQCAAGTKKMALQNGLIWKGKSVTPCARTNMIGGIPIASDMCPYCSNCRSSPETMEYHLLWDDTRADGNHRLAYFPVCSVHVRPYQGENWELTSLTKNRYLISNSMRSMILGYRAPDVITWYDTDDTDESENRGGELSSSTRLRTAGKVPVRMFARGRRAQKESKAVRNRRERNASKLELAEGYSPHGKLMTRPRSKAKMRRDLANKMKSRAVKRERRKKKKEK